MARLFRMFPRWKILENADQFLSTVLQQMMSKSVTFTEPDSLFFRPACATVAEGAGFQVTTLNPLLVYSPLELSKMIIPEMNVRLRVDLNELIITEAPLLNEEEQGDAREALIADQVFESDDWPSRYLNRDFTTGERKSLRLEARECTIAGIKFGWAIEQVARIAAELAKKPVATGRLEIVMDAATTITPGEHLFIGLELLRRGVAAFDLVLPWGGRWEPVVDWIGDVEAFETNLSVHRAIAQQNGWRMCFDHAEQKFSVLPVLSAKSGEHLHLNIDSLGWVEATRIIARHEPALLRELLVVAQDRFVFDKPNTELSTTEDDIRTLPDVPDSELERVFVDDFRGRQLLRFTAISLLAHETLGPALRGAIEKYREEHAALVAAEAKKHFEGWA